MPDLPKILDRRTSRPGGLFEVETLELEFSNGVHRTYERLLNSGLGAVIVVPLLDNDTVVLLREYCAGFHRYELGLVKGRLDPGESHVEAADRELKEEAGYGAGRIEIINSLSMAPAYMSHETVVVLARDLYPCRLPGDEPEPIETVTWPLADLHELALREDMTEGRTVAALYLARDYLENES